MNKSKLPSLFSQADLLEKHLVKKGAEYVKSLIMLGKFVVLVKTGVNKKDWAIFLKNRGWGKEYTRRLLKIGSITWDAKTIHKLPTDMYLLTCLTRVGESNISHIVSRYGNLNLFDKKRIHREVASILPKRTYVTSSTSVSGAITCLEQVSDILDKLKTTPAKEPEATMFHDELKAFVKKAQSYLLTVKP